MRVKQVTVKQYIIIWNKRAFEPTTPIVLKARPLGAFAEIWFA